MLKSLNFSLLSSFDLYDLANISLQLLDNCTVFGTTLNPFVENLRDSLKSYEKTFQRKVVSSKMERKTLLASKRNEAFIAFYRFVEASCHRLSGDKNILATSLLRVLQKHKWQNQKDGYQKQNKGLPALIRELEEEHVAAIEKLGALDWFKELMDAQVAFDVCSEEKKIDAYKEISIRETRPMVEDSLRTLFDFVELLYQTSPNEELGRIIYNINRVIRKLVSKELSAFSLIG